MALPIPVALTTALVALIPKAVSDFYDYLFNEEELQIKKKPDKTVLHNNDYNVIRRHYTLYLEDTSRYGTQQEFTNKLNDILGLNKSVGQMMRAAYKASKQE